MTSEFAPVGALLVHAAVAVRDTAAVTEILVGRDWVDRLSQIATMIIALMALGLTFVAIPVGLELRRMYHDLKKLIATAHADVTPLIQRANGIGEDVSHLTRTVRAEVDRVNVAITAANVRVEELAAEAERRVKEFNALLAVVQQEAEQVFISTASAVRGVQQGAASFRDGIGMDFAFDESDLADPADDIVHEEEGDGHDRDIESSPQGSELPAAAPRLRPRQRAPRGA